MKKTILPIFILSFASSHALAIDLDTYLKKLDLLSIDTIENAIQALPEDIHSNYTLLHTPHGIRGASAVEPELIAYQTDGKFVVNVGSAKQAKGDSIEILQFNNEAKEFELYDVKFPLQRDSTGRIVRPEKNPKECLVCHGSKPVMLWGNYGDWEGAYGGNDPHDMLSGEEQTNFTLYQKQNAQTAPYRYFKAAGNSSFAPYNPAGLPNSYWTYRPNTKLGVITSHLNGQQLAQQLLASPYFEQYRHLLLAILMPCTNDNMPVSLQNALIQELKKEGSTQNLALAKKLESLQGSNVSDARIIANAARMGIYGLFQVSASPMEYFDGSITEYHYLGSTRGIVSNLLIQELIRRGEKDFEPLLHVSTWTGTFRVGDETENGVLATVDRTSPGYADYGSYSVPGGYLCPTLMKKSLEDFQAK